jgi:hypothetical protein
MTAGCESPLIIRLVSAFLYSALLAQALKSARAR